MKKQVSYVAVAIALLTIALVCAIAATLVWGDNFEWLNVYGPNIITELGGILFTVAIIDQILRREHERERQRFAAIAAKRIQVPVRNLVSLFGEMVKVSLPSAPNSPLSTYDQLFTPKLTEHLRFLDFSAQAPVDPVVSWATHVNREIKQAQEGLSDELQKYATFLPYEYLNSLEALASSDFLRLLRHAEYIVGQGADPMILQTTTVDEMRNRFFATLLRAISEQRNHGSSLPTLEQIRWGSPHIGGAFGSGRSTLDP